MCKNTVNTEYPAKLLNEKRNPNNIFKILKQISMYTKRLNNSKDLSDMGNKCGNLALLTEYGFNVPKAYGVTFNSFGQFIKPLLSEIDTIIQTSDYKTASEKIRELIIN